MLRVSPIQYSLLKANAEGKPVLRDPAAPRVKKRVEDLPENQLEALITDYLRHRGWIVTKQHAGFFKKWIDGKLTGFTIGEKGQADWRAERPIYRRMVCRVGKEFMLPRRVILFRGKSAGQETPAASEALARSAPAHRHHGDLVQLFRVFCKVVSRAIRNARRRSADRSCRCPAESSVKGSTPAVRSVA